MKNSILLFCIILLIASCKKDCETSDNILYHDIEPDTMMHSLLGYSPNMDWESCGDYPIPGDSNIVYTIDINGDSINDFLFHVKHYSGQTMTIHCPPVIFEISLTALNPGDSISYVKLNSMDEPAKYDTLNNIAIGHWASWSSKVYLSIRLFATMGPPPIYFGETYYIGIKVNNTYGWIQVAPAANNGIIIKDYALNLTENNPIRAGQKN